ncbi:peptidoglycan DD-metalloendopeptidase family protein [Polaribacter sp. HL-MS24]|uniref:peptidoglycan DD-metalloendopeptidase family protein n=1 Tax=Polaribacter sp. HL-MS24 TaxID=3077735 RepID=UPI0029352EF8|nr:peptidoglycan DD-metalloendopeptidase family protein [Polaribacter sp. HL-MS24]WOC39598.1 peptidoglycan DD-metalloendopeptidase family protein [Polaribacter sp. HL-MS24]
MAQQHFKNKFGFISHPNSAKFRDWAATHTFSLKSMFPTIQKNEIHPLDLSPTSDFLENKEDFHNLNLFAQKLEALQQKVPTKIIAGGYLEKRNLYTSDLYVRTNEEGAEKRDVHIGLDFWLPKNTPVHAILDGEVVCVTDDSHHKGYGGLLILKHQLSDFHFYTLYGHNTVSSVLKHPIGHQVKKGEQIAILADETENGDWVPHLHFEIMLTLLDFTSDFPRVAFESEIEIWKSICPDPNLLFKLEGF